MSATWSCRGCSTSSGARVDELELKAKIGPRLFWVLGGQLVLVDLIFIIFCFVNGWQIDPGVMQVWTGATVVELVGLVWIVTKYLFSATTAPDGPGRRSGPPS